MPKTILFISQYGNDPIDKYVRVNGFRNLEVNNIPNIEIYGWRLKSFVTQKLKFQYISVISSSEKTKVRIWDGYMDAMADSEPIISISGSNKNYTKILRDVQTSFMAFVWLHYMPGSYFLLEYTSLQVGVTEVQVGDKIDIVNINPVYHQALSINTVDQMAKVVVNVHSMNGYTSRCVYGGFIFRHFHNYSTSIADNNRIIGHLNMDRKGYSSSKRYADGHFNTSTEYGPHCGEGTSIPLFGSINSLYFEAGINTLILYAFQPYFYFNLTLKVVATECEGLLNPSHTLCPMQHMTMMVGPRYNVFCIRKKHYIIIKKESCVVFQRLDNYMVERVTEFAVKSMTGKFDMTVTYSKNSNTPINFTRICKNDFLIDVMLLANKSHINLRPTNVFDWGHKNIHVFEYHNLMKSNIMDNFGCIDLHLIYYQAKVTTSSSNDCPTINLSKRIQSKIDDYTHDIVDKCSIINLQFFDMNLYIISVTIFRIDPTEQAMLAHYYIHNPTRCAQGRWQIFVSNYARGVTCYDFLDFESDLYFRRFGRYSANLIVKLDYRNLCSIVVEYLNQRKPDIYNRKFPLTHFQVRIMIYFLNKSIAIF